MIIGKNKGEVIKNIKTNIINNELNKKVEVGDPTFTDEQREEILNKFFSFRKNKVAYFFRSRIAYRCFDIVNFNMVHSIKIEGLDNIKDINDGAIVTSNHFNPLDNIVVKEMINKRYHKNIYIVSQETNLALPGFLGYLVNNLNIIPLAKSPKYIINTFEPELKKVLDKKNYVLIYPEEEMWFNYRKPRPCKRGAYQFAAENNKPIISCFVEIIDTDKSDNEEFNKVKYVMHVLKPIYPDPNKTPKENSVEMSQIDYKQKCDAYEKAYGKKLDYKFNIKDIAGWKKGDVK